MSADVESLLKVKVQCPCGCGQFGMPTKKLGHPRGCKCRPCLNGRSSRKGKAVHRRIARELGAATPGYGVSSHEESWTHAFRLEVKSGAQASPVVTKFKNSREQSEASRAIGDNRPFAAVHTTAKKGDPIVVSVELEVFKAMTLIVQEVVS